MNEREATDLLHRLAGDLREVPPPVDRLVAGGRAMRRRRLRNVVGSLAVAGVVIPGAAIALSAHDGAGRDPGVTDRDPQQPIPEAAPGTRLVGLGSVVVAVPQEWIVAEDGCPRDTGVVHAYPDASTRSGPTECPDPPRDQPWARLAVGDRTTPAGADATTASAWSREVDVDGLTVTQTSYHSGAPAFCHPVGTAGDLCDLLFWVPTEDAFFHLSARGPDARETVLGVRDSVRVLPDGYTTVPFIEQWTEDAEAVEALEAARLEARLPAVDWPHSVVATDPQAGSVVEVGSTVRLIPGDG